uniref:Hexosyltransferase n=1 Tax=Paramoeba aestuarina TaxID=180227 RepID=A0A7S4PCG1_9EUKA|mmetsp:Transcript_40292/g.63761  ORF Transcript_40292/g.63761 Transcript_40292/m.63761 type:complete len:343 (+) Transcript_40292:176-1204(+)
MGQQFAFLLILSLLGLAWSQKSEHSLLKYGPFLNITYKEFREVADQARLETAALLKPILDIKCQIHVNFETEEMVIDPPVSGHVRARLCLVHQGSNPEKPVLVSLYDSLEYLRSKEPWLGFLNKAYYAEQNDRTYYIWIGDLPPETRPTHKSRRDTIPIPWFECDEVEYGELHAYKILAIFAVFELHDAPRKLLYLDSDVFIPFGSKYRPFSNIEENFNDPAVSMIGNVRIQKTTKRTLINTAHLGVRNTNFVKGLLGLWWQCNCGWRDQHGLALTMTAYFSSMSPDLILSTKKLDLQHSHGAFNAYLFLRDHEDEIQRVQIVFSLRENQKTLSLASLENLP